MLLLSDPGAVSAVRGLATRRAVVGPGPVPRPQSTRLSKHGSPGALLSLREVADAPLTRDMYTHTSVEPPRVRAVPVRQ